MVDEPESLVLVFLRRLDGKMDRLGEDMRDVKDRLTAVEERLASVEKSVAMVHGDFAGQSRERVRFASRAEASRSLRFMSERDARGPEEYEPDPSRSLT